MCVSVWPHRVFGLCEECVSCFEALLGIDSSATMWVILREKHTLGPTIAQFHVSTSFQLTGIEAIVAEKPTSNGNNYKLSLETVKDR